MLYSITKKNRDIDANLIENCMYTNDSLPVDLLVRTSGEVRLSDFLLWQVKSNRLIYTITSIGILISFLNKGKFINSFIY